MITMIGWLGLSPSLEMIRGQKKKPLMGPGKIDYGRGGSDGELSSGPRKSAKNLSLSGS